MSLQKILISSIILLGLFGLLVVFNASLVTGFKDFGDQFHFIKDQGLFFFIGVVLMFIVSRLDYHLWYRLAIPLLLIILLLLLAVFIPGIGISALGAKRWLDLGFFSLQPGELVKLTLVIYLSAWFSSQERGRFLAFLILLGVVLGLVILQPDLGTAIIITLIALILYFLSGAPIKHFLFLVPLMGVTIFILSIVAPYRLARLTTFLNPHQDPLGSSYHMRQILISLGSGGIWGVGLGKSRQKYAYLPEASTDSIFAIIAEEIGLIGVILFLLFLTFIVFQIFQISHKAPDKFGKLLGSGVGVWFTTQTLINLSAMVGLVPLTGIPLPLISYGGSSLISILIGFGIVLSINRNTTHNYKISRKKR